MMQLTKTQRELIMRALPPKLSPMALTLSIGTWVDSEFETQESCLFIGGSSDGPYATARLVGELLMSIDEELVGILVLKAPDQAWGYVAVESYVAVSNSFSLEAVASNGAPWRTSPAVPAGQQSSNGSIAA